MFLEGHLRLQDSDGQQTSIHARPLGVGLPLSRSCPSKIMKSRRGEGQYTVLPDSRCHLGPVSEATCCSNTAFTVRINESDVV